MFNILTAEEMEAIREYFDNLHSGYCPTCKKKIEKEEQKGLCVYAVPCGHRLYQGEIGAFSDNKE